MTKVTEIAPVASGLRSNSPEGEAGRSSNPLRAAALAGVYSKLGNDYQPRLGDVLQKLLPLAPEPLRPEAYYDLAAFQAMTGRTSNALDNLRVAMDLNAKRLQTDPKSGDLAASSPMIFSTSVTVNWKKFVETCLFGIMALR